MKNDNRGITLIELVICLVIFAVVVASAFGFMLAGSRSYATVSNKLNLQLQSELTMNQLGDYIIDCNACLYFKATTNSNTLFVIDEKADGSYIAHVFKYVKASGSILYGNGVATKNSTSGAFSCTVEPADLLAENVTKFDVTPISSDALSVTSAVIEVTFEKNSVPSTDKKTIALRNKPLIAVVS